MEIDNIIEIPEWFFQRASLRVAWLDVFEGWLYLEIEAECPKCLNVEKSVWIVTLGERRLVENIRCGRCGFPVGKIVLRELESFLVEMESMLRRLSIELPYTNDC